MGGRGKVFRLKPKDIQPLAPDHGGCIASDRITVDGELVGYMYREEPDDEADSGWRFLAGDEDDAYMDDAGKHGVYDVNTIANYDPEIIPYLDAPTGSGFARDEDDEFLPVEDE
jgi:hypothetical protein